MKINKIKLKIIKIDKNFKKFSLGWYARMAVAIRFNQSVATTYDETYVFECFYNEKTIKVATDQLTVRLRYFLFPTVIS